MVFAMPLQTNWYIYLALQFGVGIFDTGLDIACNTWMLEMWQESSNPYMQGMHFAGALARSLTLFSITPFLSDPVNHVPSRLHVPYTVIAIILGSVAIILFATYCTGPYIRPNRTEIGEERQISTLGTALASNDDTRSRWKWKHMVIVALGCLLMSISLNMNHLTGYFMPSFAIDVGLEKKKGTVLTAVYQTLVTFSRLAGALIARHVDVKIMLGTCFLLLVAGNTLLTCGSSSGAMIWTAVAILGIGISCTDAGVYCLLEQMIDVTEIITGLLIFSGSVISIAMTYTLGFMMETHPMVFVYMNILSAVICLFILLAFYVIDR